MLLENPATYVEFAASTMSEPEFLAEVLRRTGCGLLLDVNNVHVSCTNHHRDPLAYIDALPLDAVGRSTWPASRSDLDGAGAPLLIDSHGAPVDDAVWALYAAASSQRLGPLPTLLERDHDLPSLATLLAEVGQARELMAPTVRPRWPRPRAASHAHRLRRRPARPRATIAARPRRLERLRPGGAARGLPQQRGQLAGRGAGRQLPGRARALVGEAFFRAMAAVFVRQAPPRSPILAHYGEGFADFIAAFEPAAAVPYLADIARLETARMRSLHAADAAALSAADARSALADPDRVGDLLLHLHPSVILLRSPHAMVSIWAAHQGDDAAAELATLEVEAAEDALVLRDGLDVIVLRLPSGSAEFLGEVLAGGALGRATAAALQAEPCFDPGQLLALLLHHGALTSIDLPGRPIA